MKKRILASMALLVLAAAPLVFAEAAPGTAAPSTMKYIAASVAVGLACIGSGIAVGQIGAAAMAAMSENPELSGRALPFLGLAEGICLWGFIVALMIISAA
jgi:V/A-type H+-transporting ATPase subunit K